MHHRKIWPISCLRPCFLLKALNGQNYNLQKRPAFIFTFHEWHSWIVPYWRVNFGQEFSVTNFLDSKILYLATLWHYWQSSDKTFLFRLLVVTFTWNNKNNPLWLLLQFVIYKLDAQKVRWVCLHFPRQ